MFLYGVFVPLVLTVAPWLLVRYVFATSATHKLRYATAAPYVVPAAAIWALAMWLPGFSIGDETNTSLMHFLGGVAASILFWFVVKVYGVRFSRWWQEPLALYTFVSGLGVLNELFEFFLYETGIFPDNGYDTWWDLVANTCGLLVSLLVVHLVRHLRTPR